MAVTLVGVGAASNADSPASIQPALLAGVQENDLLLVSVFARNPAGGESVDGATGYTTIFTPNNPTLHLLYKVAGGAESAPTVTFTGTVNTVIAQVAAFRGVDTADPLDQVGTSTQAGGSDIGPIPGITPITAQSLIVVCGGKRSSGASAESAGALSGDGLTWAEIGDTFTLTGSDGLMAWSYAVDTATTTITDKTFAITSDGAAAFWVGAMANFNAAAEGSALTQNLADAPSVGDTLSRDAAKNVAEAPSATDSLVSARDAVLTLAETPIASDALRKDPALARFEAPSVADAEVKSAGKICADISSVADVFTKAATRAQAESLTIAAVALVVADGITSSVDYAGPLHLVIDEIPIRTLVLNSVVRELSVNAIERELDVDAPADRSMAIDGLSVRVLSIASIARGLEITETTKTLEVDV